MPARTAGYFTRHRQHTRYPQYRARGRPVGSGVAGAAVKRLNERAKGTEQFRDEAGVEPILTLRAARIGQDERWDGYWMTRPAYVNRQPPKVSRTPGEV